MTADAALPDGQTFSATGALQTLRVLIAEDNPSTRQALGTFLHCWGYEAIVVEDGEAAWSILQRLDAPRLAILDWGMPKVDGLEVCRRVREAALSEPPYLILLTGRAQSADIVAGLEGGADDYVTKPVEPAELRARVHAGRRVVELQGRLAARVRELEEAAARERRLQSLLPICAWCKKVRNDHNYWQRVEEYLREHADIHFTHGICPDCAAVMQEQARDY